MNYVILTYLQVNTLDDRPAFESQVRGVRGGLDRDSPNYVKLETCFHQERASQSSIIKTYSLTFTIAVTEARLGLCRRDIDRYLAW